MTDSCLFCRIAAGTLPATIVVVDGDRRLEVVGVTDRGEAERLAAG